MKKSYQQARRRDEAGDQSVVRRISGVLLVLFATSLATSFDSAAGLAQGRTQPWLAAATLQVPGLIVDRWFFFAQAKHPQNLYYQAVS